MPEQSRPSRSPRQANGDRYGPDVLGSSDDVEFPIDAVLPERLAQWMAGDTKLLLLDARAPSEYVVSHLPQAVQINYKARADEVSELFRGQIEGAVVVAYCSIGHRSEAFIAGQRDFLTQLGAAEIFNLGGGMLRWVQEHRPLLTAGNLVTTAVHTFSEELGALLIPSVARTKLEDE